MNGNRHLPSSQRRKEPHFSLEELLDRFSLVDGQFFYPDGRRAGTRRKDGYRVITFKRRQFLEHLLVWWATHKEWPSGQVTIDHINRVKDDNRPENLRLATAAEQVHNRDYKGYWQDKRGRKKCWCVGLRRDGQFIYGGSFYTEAEAAARAAELKDQRTPSLCCHTQPAQA